MNEKIRQRIQKVVELINRGEKGEKNAADAALKRLMKRFDLSDADILNVGFATRVFRYKTKIDERIFLQLINYFFDDKYQGKIYRDTWHQKVLEVRMEYLDYIQLDSAYEYFRRHAAQQFKKICGPEIARCRTNKTRNAKRTVLQKAFEDRYIIRSGIYHEEDVKQIKLSELSSKERDKWLENDRRFENVKGGRFHTQVMTEQRMLE